MSTNAQVKTQAKSPARPAAGRIPQPPLAAPVHEAERLDIADQLEGAARLGHSLGAVRVDGPGPPIIQRQEIPGEEEAEELMMKRVEGRVGAQGGRVPPEVEAAIRRARGGGRPLDGAVQQQMSEALGQDFSGVRVHLDAEADTLNQRLSAIAFTTSQDVFFRRGEYDPASARGRELIAHELTHVVQQRCGAVAGAVGLGSRMTVWPAGGAFEKAADAGAREVSLPTRKRVTGVAPEKWAGAGQARLASPRGDRWGVRCRPFPERGTGSHRGMGGGGAVPLVVQLKGSYAPRAVSLEHRASGKIAEREWGDGRYISFDHIDTCIALVHAPTEDWVRGVHLSMWDEEGHPVWGATDEVVAETRKKLQGGAIYGVGATDAWQREDGPAGAFNTIDTQLGVQWMVKERGNYDVGARPYTQDERDDADGLGEPVVIRWQGKVVWPPESKQFEATEGQELIGPEEVAEKLGAEGYRWEF